MEIAAAADDDGGGVGFECNICFGLAQDPVITRCGHLHCWPCLYEWLRFHSQSHECPVCKAVIREEELIPLYGRGDATASFQQRRPAAAGGSLLRRRSGFSGTAIGQLRVPPAVRSVRFREVNGGGGYGSFGEGGGNGEVEQGNLDHNMKKILFFILAFVVFDFLII